MGIKDHQHKVGNLCQVADHFLVVVTAIPFGNAIEHSGCVDDGKVLQKRGVDFFQAKMRGKTLSMFFQGLKRELRVVEQKLSVAFLCNTNGVAGRC